MYSPRENLEEECRMACVKGIANCGNCSLWLKEEGRCGLHARHEDVEE